MPIRMHDTEIWEEDWFIDLPMNYKLFWLYIKDRCDHAGIWRINKRKFQISCGNQLLMLDDFLRKVNAPGEDGQVVTRLKVLDNRRWWLPEFICAQQGHKSKFNVRIGTHRGFFKLLILNEIPLSAVDNFDWGFLLSLNNQQLSEIAHAKPMESLYKEYSKGTDTAIVIVPVRVSSKGVEGEKQNEEFLLKKIYDTPFEELIKFKNFQHLKEMDFTRWKQFVDHIEKNRMQKIYQCKFITPVDFGTLYTISKFREPLWDPVLRKLLSTGIQPHHDLYFRIPEFMGYVDQPGSKKKDNGMNSGGDENLEETDKW